MKSIASAEDIHAEIQRRIESGSWGNGYCADCSAPLPFRISHDGIANWTANMGATTKPGCESFLLEVIASVRRNYDLPIQPLAETVAHLLSGKQRL